MSSLKLLLLDKVAHLKKGEALLVNVRGKVAEVIQPALAGRTDARVGKQLGKLVCLLAGKFAGVMRVDAGGRAQPSRMLLRQFNRGARSR